MDEDEDTRSHVEQLADYGSPMSWLRVASVFSYAAKEFMSAGLAVATYVDDIIDTEIVHRMRTRKMAMQMKQELESIQKAIGGN